MTASRVLVRLRRFVKNDQLILSFLALAVGAATGGAVVAFREIISATQTWFYASGTERLFQHAQHLPWYWLVAAPAIGGLLVGLLIRYGMPNKRPVGVADVIEASALRGGRMSLTDGLRGAVVNAVSVGAGASVGREGPAVHLGASLGGWLAKRLHLTRSMSRTLLGCGVAAAVAASFNAPIAGALFANEVVIGHYAISAFAPTVIASVTGTAISRAFFGDFPAFIIAEHSIQSFLEFPAFVGLGILCGLVAMVLMHWIGSVQKVVAQSPVPDWVRPGIAGLLIGIIALGFPQVLGIGYGATEAAMGNAFSMSMLLGILFAKTVATAISLGGGFGGGIFSPALVIGSMLGAAYGLIATQIFPTLSSGPGAYTIAGMGAMAAAVLGAPISTALIVFEMTGDYALTMALMVSVVVATVITQQLGMRSFFTFQLERRGLDLKGGFERTLMQSLKVGGILVRTDDVVSPDTSLQSIRDKLQSCVYGELFVVRDNGELEGTITLADLSDSAFDHDLDDLIKADDVARLHPPVLSRSDDLETAMQMIRDTGEEHIAVVEDTESMRFVGCLHVRDVQRAYTRALVATRREERGE